MTLKIVLAFSQDNSYFSRKTMAFKNKLHLDSFEEYHISVLRLMEEKLHNFYKKPEKITLANIQHDEKELNIYPNFSALKPIKSSDIILLDDKKIDIKPAEKSILEGKLFWEHTAAGEATRLGLGTKYLLNLNQFSLDDIVSQMRAEATAELEKTEANPEKLKAALKKIPENINRENILSLAKKDPSDSMNLSLGNRHMLQMVFDIVKIAKKYGKDPEKVLKKQNVLLILNEQTAEEIIDEFKRFNFFKLNSKNVYFMVQRAFHGIYIKEGYLFYDKTTERNKRLHNHGQLVMQKVHNEVIFRVNPYQTGQRKYLSTKDYEKLLSRHQDLLSYNIEDLGYLTSAIDLPSLALALNLGKKGYAMIMEIVAQNPVKPQKGGACFWDQKLKKVVMIESNQLKNIKNEEIKHLNKNFNHYPNPVQAFQAVKENGLPVTFEIKNAFDQSGNKKAYLYPCPVQGDINFLVKTAFVMRKNLKPIYSWKSPATTPLAIKAVIDQENQLGFKEFVRQIKKGKIS